MDIGLSIQTGAMQQMSGGHRPPPPPQGSGQAVAGGAGQVGGVESVRPNDGSAPPPPPPAGAQGMRGGGAGGPAGQKTAGLAAETRVKGQMDAAAADDAEASGAASALTQSAEEGYALTQSLTAR